MDQGPRLARAAEAGAIGAPPAAEPLYRRGIALVMLAGVFWSLGGILVRWVEAADGWQILFYRSTALAATLFCLLALRHRRRVLAHYRAAGWTAVVGGLCLGTGFTGWIFALLNTTVANGVFILGAAPLATAVLAWILLRERVAGATWISMAFAIVGIGVMVHGGIRAGALFGNLMALLAMLGFSGFAVAIRAGRAGDMLPTVCYAGLFAAIGAGLMAGDFAVSAGDLAICVAMGSLQIGFGLILFVTGSRHLPAAEIALLSLTEVILAPVWVWVGVGEVPSASTLLGGGIVLAAIAGRAALGLRRRPPPLGAV